MLKMLHTRHDFTCPHCELCSFGRPADGAALQVLIENHLPMCHALPLAVRDAYSREVREAKNAIQR